MSDTPRTDALHTKLWGNRSPVWCYEDMHKHARQLERELAAAEKDNFALAAGQCCIEAGLVNDEHGHTSCAMYAQRNQLQEQFFQEQRAHIKTKEKLNRVIEELRKAKYGCAAPNDGDRRVSGEDKEIK